MITILTSYYNDFAELRKSVDPLLNVLNENRRIVIVDDGSAVQLATSHADYADNAFITVVTNGENLGLTASLNRGAKVITHGLVLRLDAGDQLNVDVFDHLETLATPLPALSFMQAVVYDNLSRPCSVKPDKSELRLMDFVFGNPVVHGSVVLNRDAWTGNWPPYDRTWLVAQDYELWTRVIAVSQYAPVIDFVGYQYFVGTGISAKKGVQQALSCVKACRAFFKFNPLASIVGQLFWSLIAIYRAVKLYSR